MLESVFQYYGVDIIAMLLTFAGIYLIGNKTRYGFLVAVVGNILWVTLGTLTSSIALIITNVVLILLYLRAYKKWSEQ